MCFLVWKSRVVIVRSLFQFLAVSLTHSLQVCIHSWSRLQDTRVLLVSFMRVRHRSRRQDCFLWKGRYRIDSFLTCTSLFKTSGETHRLTWQLAWNLWTINRFFIRYTDKTGQQLSLEDVLLFQSILNRLLSFWYTEWKMNVLGDKQLKTQ